MKVQFFSEGRASTKPDNQGVSASMPAMVPSENGKWVRREDFERVNLALTEWYEHMEWVDSHIITAPARFLGKHKAHLAKYLALERASVAPPALSEAQLREKFEAEIGSFTKVEVNLSRTEAGEYKYMYAQMLWNVWKRGAELALGQGHD